jgi:hypothetical protein
MRESAPRHQTYGLRRTRYFARPRVYSAARTRVAACSLFPAPRRLWSGRAVLCIIAFFRSRRNRRRKPRLSTRTLKASPFPQPVFPGADACRRASATAEPPS